MYLGREMASGDAVNVDQVDVVHSPSAVAARAADAQQRTAAVIRSLKSPPFKNLLFREVIMACFLFKFEVFYHNPLLIVYHYCHDCLFMSEVRINSVRLVTKIAYTRLKFSVFLVL